MLTDLLRMGKELSNSASFPAAFGAGDAIDKWEGVAEQAAAKSGSASRKASHTGSKIRSGDSIDNWRDLTAEQRALLAKSKSPKVSRTGVTSPGRNSMSESVWDSENQVYISSNNNASIFAGGMSPGRSSNGR